MLQVFVWRNPELSMSVPVRPDGKVAAPLVDELVAQGKTSTELARDVEKWPADKPVTFRHTAKAPGTASPGESKQDRFGLVVSSVTRQNDGSAVAFGGASQRSVSRVASSRFWATFGSHDDVYDLDRLQPERVRGFQHRGG